MKTFDDLIFKPHIRGGGIIHATMHFDNRYGISVIDYNDDIDNFAPSGCGFEIAVLKNNELCYDTKVADDVLRYLNKKEVTKIMEQIQNL